eukprot:48787_1
MCDMETICNSISVYIKNWEEYSQQSFNANTVQHQFENLLNSNQTIIHETKEFNKCPHKYFHNQQEFLDILWKYIINDKDGILRVKQYNIPSADTITNPIKTGCCINCIQKFIIKTNGLRNIFTKWQNVVDNDIKCRSEFHQTNIMFIKQPIFLKWLLFPTNIQSLTQIFNLFFVTYLQNTNLDALVIRNESDEDIPIRIWYSAENVILNTNINIMHGIEHSLSSLSTTINELVPLLKLCHIQHLFLTNPMVSNVALIIDKFVRQYVKMPHISAKQFDVKIYEKFTSIKNFKKWRKKMLTDELFAKNWKYRDQNDEPVFCIGEVHLSIDDTIELFLKDKHVILQRIMKIFAMLYKKFVYYYKKLQKRNVNKNRILIQQLRMEITIFEYLMYGKQHLNTKKGTLKHFNKVTMNDHIWSLVAALLPIVNNTISEKNHNGNIRCAVCHRQQKNERIKFKVCQCCQITYYCRKKCQKYDWNKNQHKYICKQLVAVMNFAK